MAWRRHNRHLTHEVFYEGTTVDGSRLEKGMRDINDGFNDVALGDIDSRFVAVQYHGGFSPQPYTAANKHHFPWLEIRNQATVDVVGETPSLAPFNQLRFKGTEVPGIALNDDNVARDGTQWAWTRTFSFKRPVVLQEMSVLMHLDSGIYVPRPYKGEDASVAGADAYEFGNSPPAGFSAGDYTSDVCVLVDVFNPSTPEDATMTDMPYVRRRWVVNREVFNTFKVNVSGVGWDDMFPHFDSGDMTTVRALDGRLLEDKDLNIPIPANSKVRVAVIIPQYNNSSVTSSWGAVPWYVQAWSGTLTVLEEIQAL